MHPEKPWAFYESIRLHKSTFICLFVLTKCTQPVNKQDLNFCFCRKTTGAVSASGKLADGFSCKTLLESVDAISPKHNRQAELCRQGVLWRSRRCAMSRKPLMELLQLLCKPFELYLEVYQYLLILSAARIKSRLHLEQSKMLFWLFLCVLLWKAKGDYVK